MFTADPSRRTPTGLVPSRSGGEQALTRNPALVRAAGATAAVALVLAGCTSSGGESASEGSASKDASALATAAGGTARQPTVGVRFDGSECFWIAPAELSAGAFTLEATNNSDLAAEIGIFRIDDNAIFGDVADYYLPEEPASLPLPDFAEPIGSTPVEPDQSASTSVQLDSGRYGVLCQQAAEGEDDPAAWLAGPGAVVVVPTPTDKESQETLAVTFDGTSCAYDGPSQLPSSTVKLEGVNDSEDGVAIFLVRLLDGATFDEFVEFHQPEPKLGSSALDNVDLTAVVESPGSLPSSSLVPLLSGDYALACITDYTTPNPATWVAQPGGVSVTG